MTTNIISYSVRTDNLPHPTMYNEGTLPSIQQSDHRWVLHHFILLQDSMIKPVCPTWGVNALFSWLSLLIPQWTGILVCGVHSTGHSTQCPAVINIELDFIAHPFNWECYRVTRFTMVLAWMRALYSHHVPSGASLSGNIIVIIFQSLGMLIVLRFLKQATVDQC